MSDTLPATPVKILCTSPGYEGSYILFKAQGWKYKHLREWENAAGAGKIAAVVSERIESWNIEIDGKNVVFKPGPEAFDELPPALATWATISFRKAYDQAGLPSPN
jgi:hypothetical protein